MKEAKVVFFVIACILLLGLARIIVVFVFDMASIAAPSDRHGADAMNEWFEEEAEYFGKKAYKTEEEKRKAYNDAGLFYNPETKKWEEDPEKFSRYLNAKYGYNPDR